MEATYDVMKPDVSEMTPELEIAVESLQVIDERSANTAGEIKQEIATHVKMIKDKFEEPINKAFAAHRSLTAWRKECLEPFEKANVIINNKLSAYFAEVERQRLAEQRRLEEEARARREAEAKALREQAETEARALREQAETEARALAEQGREDEADQIMDAAIAESDDMIDAATDEAKSIQQTYIAPSIPKTKIEGVTFRKSWKFEVSDLMELATAIVNGKAPLAYIEANTKSIGGVVTSLKGQAQIPGVRVWCENLPANKRIS